jgi:hypothetical protein
VLTQLKALAFLVVGLGLIIGPFVAYGMLTRPDMSTLFAHLRGARTPHGELIIDGARGSFAGLRVGMPFVAAQERLPGDERQNTSFPPSEFVYADGSGLLVTIASACGTQVQTTAPCPAGSQVGPLAEIDIEVVGGYVTPNMGDAIRRDVPGSQQVVTSKGLRFGDSLKTLKRKYAITSEVVFPKTLCRGDGASYTAIVGGNTMVFDVAGNAVDMISLFPGREPQICST